MGLALKKEQEFQEVKEKICPACNKPLIGNEHQNSVYHKDEECQKIRRSANYKYKRRNQVIKLECCICHEIFDLQPRSKIRQTCYKTTCINTLKSIIKKDEMEQAKKGLIKTTCLGLFCNATFMSEVSRDGRTPVHRYCPVCRKREYYKNG